MARKVREKRLVADPPSRDYTALILRYLDQIAEKGIYAILLLVPPTFLPNAYWPFDIPKVTLIRVLTIIILCAYLSRSLLIREFKIIRPPAIWPILAYLLVYALSSVFSICPDLSLHSGEGRNYGLFSLINMIVLYFLTINIMTRRSQLLYCLKLLIISSSIVALLGLVQFYDFSDSSRFNMLLMIVVVAGIATIIPLIVHVNREKRPRQLALLAVIILLFILLLAKKSSITTGLGILSGKMGDRASATFGNPDFLISFLLVPLIIAYGYVLKGKWIYSIPLVLLIYCMIIALPFKDMGDYRMIIVASCYLLLIPIAVIYATSRLHRIPAGVRDLLSFAPRKYLPYGIVFVSLLPIIVVGTADIFASHDKISKFTRHHLAGENTDRSMLAEIALDSFGDYPILGSGPNTYRNTFTVYAGVDYAQLRAERREDKVHNSFVEAISTTGALGFATYIFMWIGLFWFYIRWLWKNRSHPDFMIIGSIFIAGLAYVLHTVFIFHTTTPFTFFWIIMAAGMGLAIGKNPQYRKITVALSGPVTKALIIAVMLPLACVAISLSLRPLIANIQYFEAERYYNPQYPESASLAIPKYEKSIDWFKHENRYRWSLSIALLTEALNTQNADIKNRNCAYIEELMDESIEREPESAMLYYNRAIFRINCGGNIQEIMEDTNKSIEMYPSGYMLYRFRADLYTRMGRLEEAIADDELSLSIKPGDFTSTVRLGKNYIAVGDQYATDNEPDTDYQKQYEAAARVLEEAITIKPKDVTAQYLLAVAHHKAGLVTAPEEWNKTINMLQQRVEAEPKDIEAHYMLGVAYETIGEIDRAREQYQEVLELDPRHQRAIEALERLG